MHWRGVVDSEGAIIFMVALAEFYRIGIWILGLKSWHLYWYIGFGLCDWNRVWVYYFSCIDDRRCWFFRELFFLWENDWLRLIYHFNWCLELVASCTNGSWFLWWLFGWFFAEDLLLIIREIIYFFYFLSNTWVLWFFAECLLC